MTPTMRAGAFDGPLYDPLPPPPGGLLTLVHLIGWATCAACLVGFVVTAAAMGRKRRRGASTPAPTPGGDEAVVSPAPLGVLLLGWAVIAAGGAVIGLVV